MENCVSRSREYYEYYMYWGLLNRRSAVLVLMRFVAQRVGVHVGMRE